MSLAILVSPAKMTYVYQFATWGLLRAFFWGDLDVQVAFQVEDVKELKTPLKDKRHDLFQRPAEVLPFVSQVWRDDSEYLIDLSVQEQLSWSNP